MKDNEQQNQATSLDWKPLFGAFEEAFEWALNTAAQFAQRYPVEVASVERVRAYLRNSIARAEVSNISVRDVLFTFALFVGAIARNTYESRESRMGATA